MHCEKYNQKGLGNLLSHYERKNNKFRKYSNESIDKEKTCLNYNLAPERNEGLYKFIKNKVTELNISKRKNAIWACDWCLTVPEDIKEDKEKCDSFFKASYEFLKDRYGEENVVSAYCHFDETTPHLHFCFIPIVTKQVCEFDMATASLQTKTVSKVCAKECINRVELQTIHSDLQRYLDTELSFDAKVVNGATKGKNMSVKELKYKSELEKEIREKSEQLEKMKKDIMAISTNFLNLTEKANKYNHILGEEEQHRKQEIKATSEHINNLLNTYEFTFDNVIKHLEYRDNKIYDIDTSYKKSLEVLKELEKTVKESKELEKEIETKSKEYKKAYDNDIEL